MGKLERGKRIRVGRERNGIRSEFIEQQYGSGRSTLSNIARGFIGAERSSIFRFKRVEYDDHVLSSLGFTLERYPTSYRPEWLLPDGKRKIECLYREVLRVGKKFDVGSLLDNLTEHHGAEPTIEVITVFLNEIILECLWGECSRSVRRIVQQIIGGYKLSDYFDSMNDNNISDNKRLDILQSLLVAACNEKILASSEFDWIDPKNERLCDYVWSALKICEKAKTYAVPQPGDSVFGGHAIGYPVKKDKSLKDDSVAVADDVVTYKSRKERGRYYVYARLGLNPFPRSYTEKRKNIIKFFDLWDVNISSKRRSMNHLREKWMDVSLDCSMVNWVLENDESIMWAWKYINKNCILSDQPIWFNLSKLNDADIRLSYRRGLITFYDLLPDNAARTRLLDYISKSLAQVKFRRGRGVVNISEVQLSKEVERKLMKLMSDKKVNAKKLITELIESAYEDRQKR